MPAGRFAPSPTGDLHIGNLRTALLAWLFARSTGRDFLMRVEDLDRVRAGSEASQLADLRAIGLDWDGDVSRQSARMALYGEAVAALAADGLLYECFCSRREIREATSAPHEPTGRYPGTCRELTETERAQRRLERPAALRLRSDHVDFSIDDLLHGTVTRLLDDIVLVRNDGAPAYNLAVVVDDAAQGIDQVVRGDDLLDSAPSQAYLCELLGLPTPTYAHVPLALGAGGQRLAKRDGAVTLVDLAAQGTDTAGARALMLISLGLPDVAPYELLKHFEPAELPREPWIFTPPATGRGG